MTQINVVIDKGIDQTEFIALLDQTRQMTNNDMSFLNKNPFDMVQPRRVELGSGELIAAIAALQSVVIAYLVYRGKDRAARLRIEDHDGNITLDIPRSATDDEVLRAVQAHNALASYKARIYKEKEESIRDIGKKKKKKK
ncbi:hypothetical protein [Vibrio sp. DNB22_19_2]